MKWIICVCVLLSFTVSSWQYEPGTSYKYSYKFTFLLNEDSNHTSRSSSVGRHVGYKVTSDVLLTNIWQNSQNVKEQLLKLELMKPKLLVSGSLNNVDADSPHWSKLENLSYPPIYFHWEDGMVKKVYLIGDTESMVNIKKGLASLFQFNHKFQDGESQELDVSGLCLVRYKRDGTSVKKLKSLCHPANKDQKLNSSHLRSTTTLTSSELLYRLGSDGIEEVDGTEEVMVRLNVWSQAAIFVKSKIKLQLLDKETSQQQVIQASSIQDAIAKLSQESKSPLTTDTLEVVPKEEICVDNCKPLKALVKEYAAYLKEDKIGTMKSASGYLKVLDGFRRASKTELLTVFRDSKDDILMQLMDILAATQTQESLDVAFELMDFDNNDLDIPERFLQCLATIPNPKEIVLFKTIKISQKKIKSQKLHATVLITLSSLLKSYCKYHLDKANPKIVGMAKEFILQGLKCKEPQCLLLQLYAMKNAAQPDFIPFLLKTVVTGGNAGKMALEALKEIGVEHFTPEVIVTLEKVYKDYWPFQDTSARVLAAELLLRANPSLETIRKLVDTLSDRDQPEVATLVLATIRDLTSKIPAFKLAIQEVLKDISYGNYNNLAQNGSSTTYTKLLQAAHDSNMTYSINLEMRKTGVLKRTSMDLKIVGEKEELQLLSLGLFVSGFGLTDEEIKAMDVPEENSAGMELSVLGVHIRPYTFFTGSTELMGLVWSGAGSELTPALRANLLLMDEKKYVVLQNGLSFDFILRGAVSADISGSMEISMWNKNAQAVVKNNAALLVRGLGRIDTSFFESRVDFGLGGSTLLDMNVNLDFSSKPMKMCLQIDEPDFNFRHNVRKMETIPGSKHLVKTVKRRKLYFPAKSLALHQTNYETCRELLNPEPKSFW